MKLLSTVSQLLSHRAKIQIQAVEAMALNYLHIFSLPILAGPSWIGKHVSADPSMGKKSKPKMWVKD